MPCKYLLYNLGSPSLAMASELDKKVINMFQELTQKDEGRKKRRQALVRNLKRNRTVRQQFGLFEEALGAGDFEVAAVMLNQGMDVNVNNKLP